MLWFLKELAYPASKPLWCSFRSAGDVVHMPNHWLPKRLLYCELKKSKCSQGRQRQLVKDI
uniref:Uncharacterized protein n=1 Tax=Arion vulgaris TaxID=1028688 RepID=A0A0B7AQ93_9EUPU